MKPYDFLPIPTIKYTIVLNDTGAYSPLYYHDISNWAT